MLTKEEYEKTLSRIIDSVRIKNGLSTTGSLDCTDINLSNCKDTCPLHYLCTGFDRYYSPFLFIEEVEKWGKNIRLLQIEKSGKKFSDQQKFLCASKLIEKTHAMNMDVAA